MTMTTGPAIIGKPGSMAGAGGAAAVAAVAAHSTTATSTHATDDLAIFPPRKNASQYTFAPPLLRELTHIPVSICPLLLISMFDANTPPRTPP
jgi:hypothetical protein